MRIAGLWPAKSVVMNRISGKRAVLESWAAENLLGERENLSHLIRGASTLNINPVE